MLYINEYNKMAARKFALSLQKVIGLLALFPAMGKISDGNIQIFKFLVPDYNYWIVYTYSDTQLEVLRIVHTSRNV